MKPPTHIALERGQDARTPSKYRREVLLRETENFWISTSGTKYRKPDGSCPGDWPMYRLIVETMRPLPTHTGALVKNEVVNNPKTSATFRKPVSLWNEGDTYKTIYGTTYRKEDGFPTDPSHNVRLDTNSINEFSLPNKSPKGKEG